MKVHTKVVYQMTDKGLEVIQDTCHEYKGPVSKCKGGGDAPQCPQPDNTVPYGFEPPNNQVAMPAAVGNAGMQAGQNAGIAALPGAPGQGGPAGNPLGGPGGQGAGPMQPGMGQQIDPMAIMGMGGQQPQIGNQINQFDPNNPYNNM